MVTTVRTLNSIMITPIARLAIITTITMITAITKINMTKSINRTTMFGDNYNYHIVITISGDGDDVIVHRVGAIMGSLA